MPKPKSDLKAKSASSVLPSHAAGETGIGALPFDDDRLGILLAVGSGTDGGLAAEAARARHADGDERDEGEDS